MANFSRIAEAVDSRFWVVVCAYWACEVAEPFEGPPDGVEEMFACWDMEDISWAAGDGVVLPVAYCNVGRMLKERVDSVVEVEEEAADRFRRRSERVGLRRRKDIFFLCGEKVMDDLGRRARAGR